MPIICDLRLDSVQLAIDVPERATVERWLAPERTMLEPGTRLATVGFGVFLYGLHTRFRCMLWSTCVEEGATVERGALVAQLAAEDEDMPTDSRYCTLEPFFTRS